MSFPILLGVGAIGAAVILVGRSHAAVKSGVDLTVHDNPPGGASGSQDNVDVGEPQNNVAGATGIAGEVAAGTSGDACFGGVPVAGTTGYNQTATVQFQGPSGEPGMAIRNDVSQGGADPSSLSSGKAIKSYMPLEETNVGSGPAGTIPTNPAKLIYHGVYGPSGAYGVPKQQLSKAYGEYAALAGEVF